MTNIIYRQGDLVWINFNPTQGHEQKGQGHEQKRP